MSNNNENEAPQSGEQGDDLQTQEYQDDDDYEEDGGQDDVPTKGSGKPVKRAGRRKINIEFIKDKSRRHITFSKRKAGIMKKAYELSTLTGTQVLLLVASETGHVYTFATPKLQPLITKTEGKNLIQACLNSPDPAPDSQQDDAPASPPQAPASNNSHAYHHHHEPVEDDRKPKRIKTESAPKASTYPTPQPPMAQTPTPQQQQQQVYPPTAPSPMPPTLANFDMQAYAAQLGQTYPTQFNANYLQSLSQMSMPPTSATPQPGMHSMPTAPSPVPQRLPPSYAYPTATNPLQHLYGLSTTSAPNQQQNAPKMTMASQPPLPTMPGHAFVNPNAAYHIPSMHSAPSPAPQHDYQKQ